MPETTLLIKAALNLRVGAVFDVYEDPKIMVAPLGKPMPPAPEKEWENNIISVDVGAVMKFQHAAVKMQRTEEGDKLIGNLRIC